ncbi:MAG: hypothetical protein ACFCU2_12990 [Acidimicrobiia bacterium]
MAIMASHAAACLTSPTACSAEISAENSSTIVFPLPMELLRVLDMVRPERQ